MKFILNIFLALAVAVGALGMSYPNTNDGVDECTVGPYDDTPPFSLTSPEGTVYYAVFVKLDRPWPNCVVYDANTTDACRRVEGIGTNEITVQRLGCEQIVLIQGAHTSVPPPPGDCTTAPNIKDTTAPFSVTVKNPWQGTNVFSSVWIRTLSACYEHTLQSNPPGCYRVTGLGTRRVDVELVGMCESIQFIQGVYTAGLEPSER